MNRMITLVVMFLVAGVLCGSHTDAPPCPVVQACRLESDVFIGLEVAPLTLAEEQSLSAVTHGLRYGLKVTRVTPGSPAEKAGIKEGEILLRANGGPLQSPLDLLAAINRTQAGIPLHFGVWRETGTYSVPVFVAARPHPKIVGEVVPDSAPYAAIADKVNPLMDAVARLLMVAEPDYQCLREKLLQIYALEGNPMYPDNIRLYYETDKGHVYVTLTGKIISIEVHEGAELYSYTLKQQGDLIPPAVQRLFAQLL